LQPFRNPRSIFWKKLDFCSGDTVFLGLLVLFGVVSLYNSSSSVYCTKIIIIRHENAREHHKTIFDSGKEEREKI